MWQDTINGIFELGGGLAIFAHCWKLWKDKMVRGVSWVATAFFWAWGWWNLYYYPFLDQWWSLAGGSIVVTANTLWIGMMFYYIRKERLTDD